MGMGMAIVIGMEGVGGMEVVVVEDEGGTWKEENPF